MVAESIENLKREYTDKYVVVDPSRPELARFRDITGQVKTVNMSGRALVEFMDYHLNIGWYDIDTAYLKVVDKPLPKAEKPKAEKKPAAKAAAPAAKAAPASSKPAAAQPAAAGAGKMSVAEMLAAARAGKGGAAPAKGSGAAPSAAKPKAAPAADKQPAAKPAAGGKMSVAEMLAAARASAGAAEQPTEAGNHEPQPEAASAEAEAEAVAVAEPDAKSAAEPASASDGTSARHKVDRSKMSVAEMIAYARQSDGQG